MVLLPDDWRSWDDSERRAVLAHELAHIIRGDYAIGLMAQAAVVLHAYHPLVRWMAGRLQMQQELAADACWEPGSRGGDRATSWPSRPGLEAGWTVPVLAGEGVPPAGRGR